MLAQRKSIIDAPQNQLNADRPEIETNVLINENKLTREFFSYKFINFIYAKFLRCLILISDSTLESLYLYLYIQYIILIPSVCVCL
jgi:hypothetical protein